MSSLQNTPTTDITTAPSPTLNNPASTNPKPCCVCKEEKATRDECMLFSKSENPDKDCASTIDQYRSCMAGFGFKMA